MHRWRLGALAVVAVSFMAAIAAVPVLPASGTPRITSRSTPENVDISQRPHNEAEETIAINPTDPTNIVAMSNLQPGPGMFETVSFDGGATWHHAVLAAGDNLGYACCDESLSFDRYGNLFVTYLLANGNVVPVALSIDGGQSFTLIHRIRGPKAGTPVATKGVAALGQFIYVDQPTITTGHGEAWVSFNGGGPMWAAGVRVFGKGLIGRFRPPEEAPNSTDGNFGDIAIGPKGQVLITWQRPSDGQGPGRIFENLDPDGLGPQGFEASKVITWTNVGGFDYIPAQSGRSVDAESGLAWDRTNGPHAGRLYMVYTQEKPDESNNMDIEVRRSDDSGLTWSAPVRVNDDAGVNSQFLPRISLDPTTGDLAVSWHDCRNDLGDRGFGDTNGIPNDDAMFYASFSVNGGVTFRPNIQVSAGVSNAADAGSGVDYGDYTGLDFYGGVARPVWADNSNSTGNNPDGKLHSFDLYQAAIRP